jgi:uncharacterized protein (TIGR01777 family)
MKTQVFERSVESPVGVERLWDWHMRPGAFERLAPPWQRLLPISLPERPEAGAEAVFKMAAGPFRLGWQARLGPVEEPYRFVDTQVKGPFASWVHEHCMEAVGDQSSRLTDRVTYSLPLGLGSVPVFRKHGERELERLFAFRHQRMKSDLERFPDGVPGAGRIVLVTGSTGLIGSRLVPYLRTLGFRVRGLSRNPTGTDQFAWNPAKGEIDKRALDDVFAVIHLAGENIASGRWTPERRRRILDSRVDGTRTLVDALLDRETRPEVIISASGANFYAVSPDCQDESAPAGEGFLAEVCRHWEAEAFRAHKGGIRTVCLRTGVVLDPLGGALGKMLPAFRLGLGGPIGNGRQGFPWIAMDDLLDVYVEAILNPSMDGPVNAVHSETIDQRTFSRVLGSVLRRPTVVPLPAFVVKVLFGQMGREALLGSLFLEPGRLKAANFRFRHASLKDALQHQLGKLPA